MNDPTPTPTHVYDTRSPLTKGIVIRKVDEFRTLGDGKKLYAYCVDKWFVDSLSPSDWHTTKAKAIAAAEKKRDRKIASLEKQLANLRAMTFTAPDLPEK